MRAYNGTFLGIEDVQQMVHYVFKSFAFVFERGEDIRSDREGLL